MTLKWTPVNPDAHNAMRSSFRDLKITPLGDAPSFSSVSVNSYYLGLDTALSLGFDGLGHLVGKANVSCLMVEVALYNSTVKVVSHERGYAAIEREGAGFRIALGAADIELKSSFNVGALAAAAELHSKSVLLQVLSYGAIMEQLRALKELSRITRFDGQAVSILGEAATQCTQYLAHNEAKIKPVPLRVSPLATPGYSMTVATYSRHYALEGIYHRRSFAEICDQVVKRRNETLADTNMMWLTYLQMGVRHPGEEPSGEMSSQAGTILTMGR